MSDLDLIAQIDEKIHQLPAEILPQVNDYVSLLLQNYQHAPLRKVRKNTTSLVTEYQKLQALASSWEGEELQRAPQELMIKRMELK